MGIKEILNKEIKIVNTKVEYLSFDFGNRDIRIAKGNFKNNKITLNNCYVLEFDKEVYQNGKILEFDAIVSTVKDFLKENDIKTKEAIFTISSTESLIRTFEIPKIESDEDQHSAIEFEIIDKFPGDFSDYTLEYRITDEIDNMCSVLTCAIPKYLVEEKLRLFKEIGLNLKYFDAHTNSIAKLINYTLNSSEIKEYSREEKSNTTIALVDISSSVLSVNIFRDGKLEFHRTVNNEFNKSYVDLFYTEKPKEISANEDYTKSLELITEDIEKSFKFYTSRGIGNVIDEIYIHGYENGFNKISNNLKTNFGEKVKRISTLNEVININDKKYANEDIGLFINCVSSLIRLD